MIARAKLESIIAAHKRRLIDVEIIDVIEQPELAVRDNVVVTPMLLRLTPTPRIKMIGNLNDRPSVMRALGLDRHDDKVE
jgi:circadian clock protein KaiB